MDNSAYTPEEHLADIAADTLARLERLRSEFFGAGAALALLARHSGDVALADSAEAARLLAGRELAERVRDVAAALPLRGLEYGNDLRDRH